MVPSHIFESPNIYCTSVSGVLLPLQPLPPLLWQGAQDLSTLLRVQAACDGSAQRSAVGPSVTWASAASAQALSCDSQLRARLRSSTAG